MELREIFAANLRHYRQEKGVSQEELAHQAGLDRTYVSSLERCVYSVSLDVIAKIATALKIQPFQLLENPDNRK